MASDFEKVKDESYNPAFSTINFGKLKQLPGSVDHAFRSATFAGSGRRGNRKAYRLRHSEDRRPISEPQHLGGARANESGPEHDDRSTSS